MSKLPASAGWLWLKHGFALFRKQPGILTMLLFTNFMISVLISTIPYIGPQLAVLLIPSLTMAVLQACHLIDQGQRVTPQVMLTGFREPVFKALCKLGLVYVGVSLLLTVLANLVIDPAFWRNVTAPVDPNNVSAADRSNMLTFLGLTLLQCLVLLALCFAAPLTYWKSMAPGKATFYSFFAVVGAFKPILLMLFAWFGIFLAAAMAASLIFGNSNAGKVVVIWIMLLFMLELQCAFYASYRQIFGEPGAVDLEKR